MIQLNFKEAKTEKKETILTIAYIRNTGNNDYSHVKLSDCKSLLIDEYKKGKIYTNYEVIYNLVSQGQGCKPFYDFDYMLKKEYYTPENCDIIVNCLHSILKSRPENNYDILDITTASCFREKGGHIKFSLHFILNNVGYYKNSKDFYRFVGVKYVDMFKNALKEKQLENAFVDLDTVTKLFDPMVYGLDTSQHKFRLILNKKEEGNDSDILVPYHLRDKSKEVIAKDLERNFEKYIITGVCYNYTDVQENNDCVKVVKSKEIRPSACLDDSIIQNVTANMFELSYQQIKTLVMGLNVKRSDDYNDWCMLAFALKNNKQDLSKLFHQFSKQSKKYDKNNTTNFWNNLKVRQGGYTINSIVRLYHKDNKHIPDDIKKTIQEQTKTDFEPLYDTRNVTEVNCEYLTNSETVLKLVDEFLNNDNQKSLCIKSPYNTGKTTLLRNSVLKEYKRILFLSYRISLSQSFYGALKDRGFKMYTKDINADKVIVQIDSLHKIKGSLEYDLCIIDESESNLFHFSASSLKNYQYQFEVLCSIMQNSKVLFLDGALKSRTKIIANAIGNTHIINNIIKKNIRHFKFYESHTSFERLISNDLKEKKKIVLIAMSQREAQKYYNKYNEKYKCMLYISTTDDVIKRQISEIADGGIWEGNGDIEGVDIVIYSSTIDSGLDYNIKYFDRVYVHLCANCNTQDSLFQQINRIRQYSDATINTYTNGLVYNKDWEPFTFKRCLNFFGKLNPSLHDFKMLENGIIEKNDTSKFNILDVIELYNEADVKNTDKGLFMKVLIDMIDDKGHTYEFMEDKKDKKKKDEIDVLVQNIVDADVISDDVFEYYKKLEAKQELTTKEKMEMKKHIYKTTLGIDSYDDVKEYYRKLNVKSNYKALIKFDNVMALALLENKDITDTIREQEKKELEKEWKDDERIKKTIHNKFDLAFEQTITKKTDMLKRFINKQNDIDKDQKVEKVKGIKKLKQETKELMTNELFKLIGVDPKALLYGKVIINKDRFTEEVNEKIGDIVRKNKQLHDVNKIDVSTAAKCINLVKIVFESYGIEIVKAANKDDVQKVDGKSVRLGNKYIQLCEPVKKMIYKSLVE